MDVDYRQVRIEINEQEMMPPVALPDLSNFPAASKYLPTGAEIYKVVKYLDLSANIEIILVIYSSHALFIYSTNLIQHCIGCQYWKLVCSQWASFSSSAIPHRWLLSSYMLPIYPEVSLAFK